MTRRRIHPINIATEGQRLLVERSETLTELADLVGVPVQRIDEWRSGRARPSGESARKLRDALGIPLEAWSRVPGAAVPAADDDAAAHEPTEPRKLTSLEEIDEMLAALRVAADGLTERERAKRAAERIQLLRLKSQIEHREKLAEDAVVRAHPRWRAIKEALRRALAKHPEALADVHAELVALGEWETVVAEIEERAIEDDAEASEL